MKLIKGYNPEKFEKCRKWKNVNRYRIKKVIKNERIICIDHIWSDIAYILIDNYDEYYKLFKKVNLINKSISTSKICQSIEINHNLLTEVLHIKKKYYQKINYIMNNYNNYIGFHIRTGSGDFKDKKRMNKETEIKMIKLGYLFNENTYFFIASDSEKVKHLFKEYYGEKVYVYSNKSFHSEKVRDDDISLIELLLLSKSNYLILTPGSTYSLVAFYLNRKCYKCYNKKCNISNLATFYPDPKSLVYYSKICDF